MSSTPPVLDRRDYVVTSTSWNGIDYVEVASADQTVLRVHFLSTVNVKGTLGTTYASPPASPVQNAADPVTITGGELVTSIEVEPVIDGPTSWGSDSEGRPILTVRVRAPGDFSTYHLTIASAVLDPYFQTVAFSFKANCPSDFDCQTPAATCPPEAPLDVPIDYLAKDFTSFCQALSEFSTQRYPTWLERGEADAGMVVMEILAAMADELSYYQDRIAGESLLGTATQPISLLRHARLVDYEPAPATVATVLLQLEVAPGATVITTPVRCQGQGAGGQVVDYQVGNGLADATGNLAAIAYAVDPRWNRRSPGGAANLVPYWWDASDQCLLAGSTQFYIVGWGHGLLDSQPLLIDTSAAASADPPTREVVTISGTPEETSDPVFGVNLTCVTMASATTADHDLTRTVFAGNLVPATQGVRTTESFFIPNGLPAPSSPVPSSTAPAVVRLGANSTPAAPLLDYLYSLNSAPLAWISSSQQDADTPVSGVPEVVLIEAPGSETPTPWAWVRWLLDAEATDSVFTLTPELYSPVLIGQSATWFDYDGGEGATLRFGNGTFGAVPAPGTMFEVTYRVGGGSAGNVPADTITQVVMDGNSGPVTACTNPFSATGGTDAETPQQVRDRAPQAFSADPLRVVRASDYEGAAQTLAWVRQAGTSFRWTGSWLTVLTTANPVATEQPTLAEVISLTQLLNRQRLAGYESYVLPPRYVSVDLQVTLCAGPQYFAGDVEAAVLAVLRPGALPGGGVGFFDHSRWSFGDPLESSALLAAIQSVTGVAGVSLVEYRQRGAQNSWTVLPETLTVAADQILRDDDDPSRPEAGSLTVIVEGGK
ncbi:MAG TPA: baseplate J/gp47 family protein [Acidimicrobiales bacterium]|nr:baseplate J/gp47 family protein [Acidimicrobiales bacterium]